MEKLNYDCIWCKTPPKGPFTPRTLTKKLNVTIKSVQIHNNIPFIVNAQQFYCPATLNAQAL